MFSLARFVHEQMNFFGDVLDKRPSQMSRSHRDPLILVIDDRMPLKDKVAKLLTSELASQQVWAISNIFKLVMNGEDCDSLVAELPRMFLHKSAKVELAAAKTAHALIKLNPQKYTHIFAQPIFDRIAAVPALEYAECIEQMAINAQDVTDSIIPLLDRLFEQDDSHQHAGCQLLRLLPPGPLSLTVEQFSKFLKSKVLVNVYLSEVAEKYASRFGEGWIALDLPTMLSGMGEPYRLGIAKYFVDFGKRIRSSSLYSVTHSAFDWAHNNEDIALALMERVPIIASSRFMDLGPKVHALIPVLGASKNAAKRIELIRVLAKTPMLLKGNESNLYRTLSSLATDKDPTVRMTFFDNIEALYKLTDSSNTRNGLVQMFQNALRDEKEICVMEKLVNPHMLVQFASSRQPSHMSLVLELASKFKTRWRFFSKILESIEAFPHDAVLFILKKFLKMIEEAVLINPQSLMRPVTSFYVFIIHSRFDVIKFNDLLNYLFSKYGKNSHYQQRIVYIKLATSLMNVLTQKEYLELIWPRIQEYKSEKIMFVKAKVLQFLIEFGQKFHSLDSQSLSKSMDELCTAYATDSDPDVVRFLAQARLLVGTKKSLSAQPSIEKLPSLTDPKPRVTKPVPGASTNRNNTPRKPPSGRMPSVRGAPPTPQRRASLHLPQSQVSPIIKSSSNWSLRRASLRPM